MGTKPGLVAPMSVGESTLLPLASLRPNPDNRNANDEDIKSLAQSIREQGLLYPLIVRAHPDEEGAYRIIAGERRYRALKSLRVESVPCIVATGDEGSQAVEVLGAVENHQRRPLTLMEEAEAVRRLLDQGLEPESVARSLGRSRAWVARRSSLTDLTPRWRAELADERSKIATWPPSHLELISRFPVEVQNRILDDWSEQMRRILVSFRDLERVTGQYLHLLSAAPWKADDESLCPKAGACAVCAKRSSHHPDLFASEESTGNGKVAAGDRCLDAVCWNEKAKTFLKRRVEEVKQDHPDVVLLDNSSSQGNGPTEAFGTRLIHAWEVAICRKSDRKAVPALVVDGPGLGRIKWIRPNQAKPKESVRCNGSKATGKEEAEPAEKTLDQRKEPYDKRRRQIVIDAVRKRLEALINTKSFADTRSIEGGPALTERGMAVRLVVLLGLLLDEHGWKADVQRALPAIPEALAWDGLSSLRKHQLGSETMRDAVLEEVWTLLKFCLHAFSRRLVVGTAERTNAAQYANAEQVCALLGFNLDEFRRDAAQAIPYAKGWRGGVVDEWIRPEPNQAVDAAHESTVSEGAMAAAA